jgi:hypothetical protein
VKKEKVIDEHTYTYLLTTKAAFNMEYFRKMCEESPLPFKEVTVDECRKNKKVGFVFSDNQIPKMRKMLHRVHSGTKNELTAAITNKAKLHDLLTVHVPEAIPETHTVTSKTKIVDGDLWIWRPAAGFKGQGVYVIKTQARMEELYKAHKEQPKTERLRHPEVIITRYIEQPLLYNKRKTTFRIFALATIIGEERHAYMFDRGFMRLAEQEYKLDDFDNMKIHDAHLNREAFNEEMFYPDHIEDLVDTKSTTEQMHSILAKVFTKALPQFIFYPESDNAFRIFGVDFMIDANGKVILIEINGRPGFNLIDPTDPKTMYKMLSEGVFHKAVHPCFGQPVKEDV